MIAIDTNILVYAHRREVKEHNRALAFVKRWAEGHERWAIPWPCLYEFYSVCTSARIWKDRASTPEQAWHQIDAWIASPSVVLLSEPEGFARVLEPLLRARVRGPVVHDARIAALCIAHGIERLVTRDRDFSLFPGLSVQDPFKTDEG